MEKKAARKTAVKKKVAEPKQVEIKSPFDEIAAEIPKPPVVKGELTSSAKPVPEPGAIATGSAKVKRSVKSTKIKKVPKGKTAKAVSKKAVTVPPAVAGGLTSSPSKPTRSKTTNAKAVSEAGASRVPAGASPSGVQVATGSPTVKKTAKKDKAKPTLDTTTAIAAAESQAELSPVFKALAEPTLPDLPRENRARLMMQTPAKLYFYWSVRENPYHLLRNVFGDDLGSYTLVLKLTELNTGVEKIHRAEAEGNFWFDVEPGGRYEAEIGFYAPNRPYFRVIYSNTIETPRHSPSPRQATDADWRVPAHKFAEVLEVAGFSQDAFDVAMAGDDHETAEEVTHTAFKSFIGTNGFDLRGITAADIRYSMMALASGFEIAELRSRISPALFAILQSNAEKIAAANAMNALTEYFNIDQAEFTEHRTGSAVYGASLINFPRTLKTVVSSRLPVVSSSSMIRS